MKLDQKNSEIKKLALLYEKLSMTIKGIQDLFRQQIIQRLEKEL